MTVSVVQTLTVVYAAQAPLLQRTRLVAVQTRVAGETSLALSRGVLAVPVGTLADFGAVLTKERHLALVGARYAFITWFTLTLACYSMATAKSNKL